MYAVGCSLEKDVHILIVLSKIKNLLYDFNHFANIQIFEFVILQAFVLELIIYFFLNEAPVCLYMNQKIRLHLLRHLCLYFYYL